MRISSKVTHGAVLVTQVDDRLEVAVRRRDDRLGHRVADRGDDDAGDLVRVLGEDALEVGDVAVLELLGELVHGLRHAAVMLDAPVAPAVVAAAGDLVAAGVGAHRAHGRVGRVRARLDEDGLLAARHDVGEPLLELVLQRLHEAEAEALVHLRLGGVVDLVLDVAEDDRPVGAEHVDVLVAVHVDDVAAVAVGDEDGVLADHEVVGPADAADAAGREPLGVLEHGHGLGAGRAWVRFRRASSCGLGRMMRRSDEPGTDVLDRTGASCVRRPPGEVTVGGCDGPVSPRVRPESAVDEEDGHERPPEPAGSAASRSSPRAGGSRLEPAARAYRIRRALARSRAYARGRARALRAPRCPARHGAGRPALTAPAPATSRPLPRARRAARRAVRR